MPKRIPLSTIVVHRDGKRVTPEIGRPFDFTSEEVAEISALEQELKARGNPQLLFRKIINEDPNVSAAAAVATENASGGTEETDYSAMTVQQLKDLAAKREVDLGEVTKKDDIIAKLKADDSEDEGL
ncbi:hypothetical protein [Pseudomonas citronellolis]|uniref:DUF7443 domain-containing protein n=1 Tax=Pseudomonas citronellolis TaxID=53408 RepID=UPI00248E5960|nr:hypothetical protein [Pseudomonas citronellolis]